ncbi:hypothetical protein GCM10010260_50870 [Streptomyces filipinensis]|uniref:Uncharacterized protein n=1 Tax=Streptomyces filipinensis TaxID=66887 RepID=A0A918IE93_9ACTN|nr:hypothetical protein GCM10010260_50870 [Streptomyces filipinensis]
MHGDSSTSPSVRAACGSRHTTHPNGPERSAPRSAADEWPGRGGFGHAGPRRDQQELETAVRERIPLVVLVLVLPALHRALDDEGVCVIACPVDYSENLCLTDRLGSLSGPFRPAGPGSSDSPARPLADGSGGCRIRFGSRRTSARSRKAAPALTSVVPGAPRVS